VVFWFWEEFIVYCGAFFHVLGWGDFGGFGVVHRGIEISLRGYLFGGFLFFGYWCEARFIRSFIAAPTPELGMPIAMIVVRFSWSRRRIAAKRLIPACRNPADESSVARISSFAIQLF